MQPHQFSWESRRESYIRRINILTTRLNFKWALDERNVLLDRLCHTSGDPVNAPELRVLVSMFNRELEGRKAARAKA